MAREPSAPNAVTPAPNVAVPPLGSTVLLCDYHRAGKLEADLFGVPTPYGRPVAHTPPFRGIPRTAREHFQRAAYYEAASIVAFQQLIFDLQTLGAPSELVRAAEHGKADEARHTRLSIAASGSFDGPPPSPWPRLPGARRRTLSALDLALDNAVAGCVNETFGTWLQLYQARAAPKAWQRAVARRIARDEARHAALSFRIFDWLAPQLDQAERRLVSSHMLQATRGLLQSSELPPDVASSIGMPNRAHIASVLHRLREALSVRA
jgi:hypothetical protein